MKKTIWKAILITFVSSFTLLLGVLLSISMIFPDFMAKTSARLGYYEIASQFAVIEYDRTRRVEDIAVAYEYAVFSDSDEQIVSVGEKLTKHDGFSRWCNEQGSSYLQYVAGTLASALYHSDRGNDAVNLVFSACPTYTKGCAIRTLAVEALSNEDKDLCRQIYGRLLFLSVEDTQEYDHLLTLLK